MFTVRKETDRKFNAIVVDLKDRKVQVKRVLHTVHLKAQDVIKGISNGKEIIAQSLFTAMSKFRIFVNELWRANQWRTSIFISQL